MSKPGVSIITCTNHPDFFMNILNNYRSQRYIRKEVIGKHACHVYLAASKKLIIRSLSDIHSPAS